MTLFGDVASSQILRRQQVLTGNQFRKGVTAPSDVTIGTTPTINALRFAATNELVSVYEIFEFAYDGLNMNIILIFSLVAGQVNNDVLSGTLDYTASILNSTGSGIGKASTSINATKTVTTANGLAAGDLYSLVFPLLAADATNPLTSANGIALEFHLTNLTGVASADLVGGCLDYGVLF